MQPVRIPDEIVLFFAKDVLGPLLNFDRIADDPDEEIATALALCIESVPEDVAIAATEHPMFSALYGITGSDEEVLLRARRFVIQDALPERIGRLRLATLVAFQGANRPAPYDHPALADLSVDSEGLVDLSHFQIRGQALHRNGFAFTICLPVGSPNCTFWLTQSLAEVGAEHFRIRLDPLLFMEEHLYPPIGYRMLVYGEPLDWTRLRGIREEDHGKWETFPPSPRRGITEYSWMPWDDELHFSLEELPPAEHLQCRGSRYAHAIYDKRRDRLSHFDLATRILNHEEYEARCTCRLSKAGKVGIRLKIARSDSMLDREALHRIIPQFFVWNDDAARYFSRRP